MVEMEFGNRKMMERPAKRGEFVSRRIAGEAIVVPIRGQMADLEAIYNMNETAAFIWERIDGRSSVSEIAQAVAEEFEVSPEEAGADAVEFLRMLQEVRLVETG